MSENLSQLFAQIESIDYYLPKKTENVEALLEKILIG